MQSGMTQTNGFLEFPGRFTPAIDTGKGWYGSKMLRAIDQTIDVDEGIESQIVAEWRSALACRKSKNRVLNKVYTQA